MFSTEVQNFSGHILLQCGQKFICSQNSTELVSIS